MKKEISRTDDCYTIRGGKDSYKIKVKLETDHNSYKISTSCDNRNNSGKCGNTVYPCPYSTMEIDRLATEFFNDFDFRGKLGIESVV